MGRVMAQQPRGKAFGGKQGRVGGMGRDGGQGGAGQLPEGGLGHQAGVVQQIGQIGQDMGDQAIHHQIAQIRRPRHAVIGAGRGLIDVRLDRAQIGGQIGPGQQAWHIFQTFAEIARHKAGGPAVVMGDQQVLAMRLQRDGVMGHQMPDRPQHRQQLADPCPRAMPGQPVGDQGPAVRFAQAKRRQRHGADGRRIAPDRGQPAAKRPACDDHRAMFGQDRQPRQRRIAGHHPAQPVRDRGRHRHRPRHQIAPGRGHAHPKRQFQMIAAVPRRQRPQGCGGLHRRTLVGQGRQPPLGQQRADRGVGLHLSPLPGMDGDRAGRRPACSRIAACPRHQRRIDMQPQGPDRGRALGAEGGVVGVGKPGAGLEAGVIGVPFDQRGLQRQIGQAQAVRRDRTCRAQEPRAAPHGAQQGLRVMARRRQPPAKRADGDRAALIVAGITKQSDATAGLQAVGRADRQPADDPAAPDGVQDALEGQRLDRLAQGAGFGAALRRHGAGPCGR
ncbi:hypothetical protein PANO111632_14750 [Paracoccus nototheniae]